MRGMAERGKTPAHEEAEVLYISFGEPEPADDADVTDQGVVVRLREGKIVGLTILNAQSRVHQPA